MSLQASWKGVFLFKNHLVEPIKCLLASFFSWCGDEPIFRHGSAIVSPIKNSPTSKAHCWHVIQPNKWELLLRCQSWPDMKFTSNFSQASQSYFWSMQLQKYVKRWSGTRGQDPPPPPSADSWLPVTRLGRSQPLRRRRFVGTTATKNRSQPNHRDSYYLGRSPPFVWTKSKRTAAFFRETVPN